MDHRGLAPPRPGRRAPLLLRGGPGDPGAQARAGGAGDPQGPAGDPDDQEAGAGAEGRAAAPPPPKGYERIQAYGDRTEAAAAPAAEGARAQGPARTFTLTPWVGAYVPLYKLSVGPAAGVTFALDLKALGLDLGRTRLDLRLDLGWARVIESGPAIVPGRGLDAGFTQDSHLVPGSLALSWHLAPSASVRPFVLAGLGTVWTQTHFTAFSAPVSDRAFGLLGVFGAGLGFQAGPGELGLEVLVDVAGVDLGPLGPVGETTLSGVRADARYALRF